MSLFLKKLTIEDMHQLPLYTEFGVASLLCPFLNRFNLTI